MVEWGSGETGAELKERGEKDCRIKEDHQGHPGRVRRRNRVLSRDVKKPGKTFVEVSSSGERDGGTHKWHWWHFIYVSCNNSAPGHAQEGTCVKTGGSLDKLLISPPLSNTTPKTQQQQNQTKPGVRTRKEDATTSTACFTLQETCIVPEKPSVLATVLSF